MEARRKEQSPGTAENPTTPKKRHKTPTEPRGQQELTQAGAKFLKLVSPARFLGRRPCVKHLPCPVWTLTVGSPLWRYRLPVCEPRHQSTSGPVVRVLHLNKIVYELVGTVEAATECGGICLESLALSSCHLRQDLLGFDAAERL